MTREEAIHFANCLKNNYTIDLNDMQSFCDMAIKALEQEPTTKNDLGVDIISRADAIKAMQNKAKKLKNQDTINGLCGAVAMLYEMPSVTLQPCDDAVSRKDVVKILGRIEQKVFDGEGFDYEESRAEIDELPSVTPQLSIPEVTALAEWIEKLTKECEEAYNKGYADGMKAQEQQTFKWCTDCKEYDQDKHCCHRWSKVIRDTVEELKQEQEPILDKIRAEIETKYGQCDICEYFEDYDYEENDISEYRPIGNIADILQVIDKYKAESEE